MLGGYNLSKNVLLALNIGYIMMAFLLIGVAVSGKSSAYVDDLPTIGGITASGVFLLGVSILGLVGTIKQSQVQLFIYMIIMALILIIQFSFACACLGVNQEQEMSYARIGWNQASDPIRYEAEKYFGCCGFENKTQGVDCIKVSACSKSVDDCPTCAVAIADKINSAFNGAGVLGLLFSFVQVISIVYAHRFRKMLKDMSQI